MLYKVYVLNFIIMINFFDLQKKTDKKTSTMLQANFTIKKEASPLA